MITRMRRSCIEARLRAAVYQWSVERALERIKSNPRREAQRRVSRVHHRYEQPTKISMQSIIYQLIPPYLARPLLLSCKR